MSFQEIFSPRLEALLKRYEALEHQLHTEPLPKPEKMATLLKEQSDLTPLIDDIHLLKNVNAELQGLEDLKADPLMSDLIHEESRILEEKRTHIEERLKKRLLPKDTADARNVIMEIRQGTGGEEAALFARDLLNMYQRYAESEGWQLAVMDLSTNDLGGVKDATLSIKGRGVFERLKFESGVHRVQRVPTTEASGRIHTSTATVTVLPEAEEIDVTISDDELRIDTFRASGAGGQHVNKTESAIRITHLPTGLVVQQQDEKSQHKNKAKAMKILRSRLFAQRRDEEASKRSEARKSQMGSGDRSERIRTYNFPQGRITDHRIQKTFHQLETMLNNGTISPLIDQLLSHDETLRLKKFEQEETASS